MLRKATLILLAVIQPSTTAVVVAIAVKSQRLHHYLLPLIIKSFTKVFRLSSISDFLSLKALALVINSDSCIKSAAILANFSAVALLFVLINTQAGVIYAYITIKKLKNVQNVYPYTVSCRICGKNLDNENAISHMKQHDKKGEIPHSDH